MKKGFTLIELLIVIAIMTILVSILISSFSKLNQNQALDKDTKKTASLIEEARSRTLFSKNDSQYGVHFATTTATLFPGTSYSAGNSSNVVVDFNSNVNLYSIALTGNGNDIIFDRLTGNTSQPGVVTLSLTTSTSTKTYLTVSGTGLVEISK